MALPLTLTAGKVQAGTSLVVDASSGQVLHAEEAGRAWHPASTTKMMTAYLALKAVKAGRIGLETAIPASALAAKQPRVKVYIKAGQEITLDNALKIMMVKSANDISYVIAEGVGGNVPDFVNMMNAEATRLGMRDTRFANPNGWHHPQQQTSARDLALLAMTMMREFPEYAGYWGIGAVQLGRQTLNNTNGLIGRYSGASGFKTGFVCASGFNVVATATRGGRTLIVVVLGALSGAERTVRASQLLDDAFGSWGGGYGTLASIPSGYGGQAPNICADVRARGGGGILADDADSAGAISYAPPAGGNEESGGRFVTVLPVQQARSAGVTQRGASGRVTLGPDLVATRRHRAPEPWADRVERQGHGSTAEERLTPGDRAREMLLMGLRLSEGVDAGRFRARTGGALADALDAGVLEQAVEAEYVEWDGERLRATVEGRLRLDALLGALVG